ncbi:right-handed parallel beta-helix repeat-containing protein [Candidatus Poribacteria bacterium]
MSVIRIIPVMLVMAAIFSLVKTQSTSAATYSVGQNQTIKTLSAIADKLQPGDTVEIDSGVYREALRLKADGTKDAPITIRGVGETRPVFDAHELNVSGRSGAPRAIFQIEGAYYIIEHLEFKNARNGNNGAGIRLLGSTNAIIRDCKVSYCDMGIFGSDRETAIIEACDVGFNSTVEHNGYSHNFYMSGNRVVVRHCYIHDCLYGQNFKTRAHYNELWYNWIADSNQGEVGPVDGRNATDRPNSNVLMVGNVIVSKPDRTGNRSKFILYGSELGGKHDGTLYLFHNTLIAGSPRIRFVQLYDPDARLVAHNNIFFGSDQIVSEARKAISVDGSHNWIPASAEAPDTFTNTIKGDAPGFLNADERDFRLQSGSPCADSGVEALEYVDGDGQRHRLVIDHSYVPHLKVTRREMIGAPDLGAYEVGVKW